ncbi:MAG: 30S ribosomal protein S20 [Thermoanaerobaculia bacterium]|jgi:small subunit ribosomal protein S20|nr:MAG: 30S ribosomal protein S20 [Thermoanaerobaculia bacterium]MBZ0100570.1 30S ribosomal protein S20 [Thermoanaerobaculia bacterium]
MANTKSAKKRAAKSALQREKNRAARSTMRTAVKKVRKAVGRGDAQAAEASLAEAISTVDRTAQKGVVHRNTAARTKSRLSAAVRKLAK